MSDHDTTKRLGGLDFEYVSKNDALVQLCDRLAQEAVIGLDTEFVSEDCYEPDLCLVQLSTKDNLYLVDPKSLDNMDELWDVLTSGNHATVVHSGREELRFGLRTTGKRLANLFDIQIAAGFTGLEYPAAYSTLVSRLADQILDKGETRTNWRMRPLSKSQLKYALQDVVHLLDLKIALDKQLAKLDRGEWFQEEMESWQRDIEASDSEDRWRRVSGAASLSRRGLQILKQLWHWREEQGRQKNRPARRMLRDDLMVELARRETSDARRIRSVRGFERSDLKRHLPEFSQIIEDALSLPANEYPKRISTKGSGPPFRLVGQFLVAAAGCYCREANIAASLVGTAQDFREFAALRLGYADSSDRANNQLARGWRETFIASMLDDLLAGKLAMRISAPEEEQPLSLDRFEGSQSNESD